MEYLEDVVESKSLDDHIAERREFIERFDAISSTIQELLNNLDKPESPNRLNSKCSDGASVHSCKSSSILRLPPMALLIFEGDLTKFLSCRNTFVSLVKNNDE